MNTLDVCRRESGKLWHRKPTPTTNDGLILDITHKVSSALTFPTRNVRFLHAAFDMQGDRFIAGDYQGNIFLFDVNRNRFTLVQRSSQPCTAMAFSLRRQSEYLVAMADYSVKCFDSESKELVASMKGHESAIHTFSLHASGRYVLTSSMDTAQLWDLDTFQRKRKLNIKQNIGIVKVFFLPMSNTIMTCFKDDSIFAWESDTLACRYQLHVPEGKQPHFKAFVATRDGRTLVAGGRSNHLYLWNLETRCLLRVLELPSKITQVKQLDFLPESFDAGSNQVLGVLAQDGIVRFININTCKLLFDIGSLEHRVSNFVISSNGRHLVAVMEGGNINLHSVQAITAEINKPPPPLVSVVKGKVEEEEVKKTVAARRKNASKKVKPPPTDQPTVSDLPEGLNMSRLLAILKGYGEYPAKYRMFIWRSILRLPENHTAYASLVDKGTHPSYEKLHEKFPIKSRKLLRVLQRTLSALAHWSPIFGETEYLPLLAFPFVKLFQNNQLVCFEVLATVLCNWCQHWFEYFPNPAINMLGMIENVLAHHDRHLLHHLIKHRVTSQVYAWPLLETMFSEVLTKDEWLQVMDNVFSEHPAFLLVLVPAYCSSNRGPLLSCTEFDDFKFFFHHRNAVDVKQVLKEAYRMMESTPDDIHPRLMMEPFTPLTKGQYPVFNKYPKFIVDYQAQERERIRQEEVEYLRQRQASLELQQETERRQAEEEAWYRQQRLLTDAESKRRKMIAEEEDKLVEQRIRLAALTRELKVKEMQMLDATRRKFLNFQVQQKEAELQKLDDDLKHKMVLRDVETQAAIDEADIRNMELQLQRKLFEQELHRDHVDATQKQRQEFEARQRQLSLEQQVSQGMSLAERDRELNIRKEMQQTLAKSGNVLADISARNQLENLQLHDELDREQRAHFIAKRQNENRMLERQVHNLMKEVQMAKEALTSQEATSAGLRQQQQQDAEIRRLAVLEDEVDMAQQHISSVQDAQHDMTERLRELRDKGRQFRDPDSSHDKPYINNSTQASLQLSLDRATRESFEEDERKLMSDVRRLREKLAQESRNKRAPPADVRVS